MKGLTNDELLDYARLPEFNLEIEQSLAVIEDALTEIGSAYLVDADDRSSAVLLHLVRSIAPNALIGIGRHPWPDSKILIRSMQVGENEDRQKKLKKYGPIHQRKSDGVWQCYPIAFWKELDVLAYACVHNLLQSEQRPNPSPSLDYLDSGEEICLFEPELFPGN